MKEILDVVSDLKCRYDASSSKKKRVQKWLDKFSSYITYYGAVLDTLAQHHPEYVALAWGTIKFLFIVSPGCGQFAFLVSDLYCRAS